MWIYCDVTPRHGQDSYKNHIHNALSTTAGLVSLNWRVKFVHFMKPCESRSFQDFFFLQSCLFLYRAHFFKKHFKIKCNSQLLGCTPQACKPCSCPASRPKKERARRQWQRHQRLSDRGSYASEAKGPGLTSCHAQQTAGRTQLQSSVLAREGSYHLYGELTSGWLISYHGNQRVGQGASR